MAKSNNLPAKRFKAGERTERTLKFIVDAQAGGTSASPATFFIDLAGSLSAINRRAYRQGLYYYVESVTVSNSSSAYFQFNTLPDTWVTKAAWVRGYRTWAKMNRLAMENTPEMSYPKYLDYKILFSSDQATASKDDDSGDLLANLQGNWTWPVRGSVSSTAAADTIKPDDWLLSQYITADPTLVDPDSDGGAEIASSDPDKFACHMLGQNTGSSGSWQSIGLINSLDNVWPLAGQFGTPELDGDFNGDVLANLFDFADNFDDVRGDLQLSNDDPPYDRDQMYGSASPRASTIGAIVRTSTGGGSLMRANGFVVPFGILELCITDFNAGGAVGECEIIFNMLAGPYHGVYAERCL